MLLSWFGVWLGVVCGFAVILNSSKSIALSMMEATDSGRQVRKTKGSLVAPKASTVPPVLPRVAWSEHAKTISPQQLQAVTVLKNKIDEAGFQICHHPDENEFLTLLRFLRARNSTRTYRLK